jgi:hypothetical protein
MTLAAIDVFACLISMTPIAARDIGQWETSDPKVREWYRALMRPDYPNLSCCGEADAYWCDDVYGHDGQMFCKITDDRPDQPLGRTHIDIGTEIEIPRNKLKWDKSNPTGHAIVFLGGQNYVFCFVQSSGV